MIQAGVKQRQIGLIRALHPCDLKSALPGRIRPGVRAVKIKGGALLAQISLCALDIRVGNAAADLYLLPLLRRETEQKMGVLAAKRLQLRRAKLLVFKESGVKNGLGHLKIEPKAVVDPAAAPSEAAVLVVTGNTAIYVIFVHLHDLVARTPRDTAGEIEDQTALRTFGIGKPQLTRVLGDRSLRQNTVAVKENGIITGLRHLFFVVKGGLPTLRAREKRNLRVASATQIGLTHDGHNLQITQIAVPTDTAHVVEAEALYGALAIIISRTVVTAGDGVGRELNHTKGIASTGMGLATAVKAGLLLITHSADHRIDVYCFFHLVIFF